MNYGKTQQIRNLIYNANKQGRTDTDTFRGTVKLHGTNGGVRRTPDGVIVGMSRNQILVEGLNNFGFAEIVESEQDNLQALFLELSRANNIPEGATVEIFGELAGPGIEGGTGINQIKHKMWFMFAAHYSMGVVDPESGETDKYWLDVSQLGTQGSDIIQNLHRFPTFQLEVDYSQTDRCQADVRAMTLAVEAECPVAKQFGFENYVGEGIVWELLDNGTRTVFKTKGDKHTASNVKSVANIDPEVLASMQEFVDYAVTERRVAQAMGASQATSRGDTGAVISWVAKDILAEESDVLEANGLTWRQVGGRVASRCRTIFFDALDAKVVR